MIYKVAPKYGRKNPLIYLSICSTVGSLSVMAVKAFGIALKLTFAGKNQFSHPSTYAFAIVVVVCVLTQMNYFNKALSQFSTNMYVICPAKLFGDNGRETVSFADLRLSLLQCQPSVLRDLHDFHPRRLIHPLPRFQYDVSRQHNLSPLWLSRHLLGCLPPQPISNRSRRHIVVRQQV